MYRVKVGESLFTEASAPSKKAARQLAAEEAVKELMADGKLQLNKVRKWKWEAKNNSSVSFGTKEKGFACPQNDWNNFEKNKLGSLGLK